MPAIKLNTFGGIIPRMADRNLPDTAAQTAENCRLTSTVIEAVNSPGSETSLADVNRKSIYLWRYGRFGEKDPRGAGSSTWLSWLVDTDVVPAPIANDQYSRIYLTDGGALDLKLYNGGTVDEDDVSKTAPNAPTITKADLFDADTSGFTAWSGGGVTAHSANGGTTYASVSHTWEAHILTCVFRADYAPDTTQSTYGLRLTFAQGGAILGYLPNDATSDADEFDKIYEDTTSYSTVCTMRVVAVQYEQWAADVADKTRITVHIDFDFGRSSAQFQHYVCTWTDAYGAESPPSDPTDEVRWEPYEKIYVACPSPEGASKVRIYRSATGTTESNFFFVAEVDPGTTYTDTLPDSSLAEVMPLIENPPANMRGLTLMAGGFMAAFWGHELFFSEPYLPYSWPTKYRLTMDFDIIGIAAIQNDLYVMTTGNPYLVSGTHPDIMSQVKIDLAQSCVSKRGIANAGTAIFYPSPDGYVMLRGTTGVLATEKLYNRAQWQALSPENFIASYHDGQLIAFNASKGYIFDLDEGISAHTTTDQVATGLYRDLEEDKLFLIQTNTVTYWNGTSAMTLTWKSKEFKMTEPYAPTVVRVLADAYTSMSLLLYAEGSLVSTLTISSATPVRVPKLRKERVWSFAITCTGTTIHEIMMSCNMEALRS